MIRRLLGLLVLISFTGCASAIQKAANNNNMPELRSYVESGGDIRGQRLLLYAALSDGTKALTYLLENGGNADESIRGYTVLVNAAFKDNWKAVQYQTNVVIRSR